MHRKVNPLLGPGPGGVGNVWFSEPHYLTGKGWPLSRPLSRLPIDVSLYPSSRSRNCRIIGVSVYRTIDPLSRSRNCRIIGVTNYRTLDLSSIVKLSQYRSLEHCGMSASHIRPLPQKEGVWEDTRMLKFASGGCASKAGLGGANHAQIRWNFARSDCKSCRSPTPERPKRRGLGGYADAKLRLRGLCLRGRARGSQPCLNTVELCPNSLQVTPGAHLKKWGLGGYADASRWTGARTMNGKQPPPPCRTTVS